MNVQGAWRTTALAILLAVAAAAVFAISMQFGISPAAADSDAPTGVDLSQTVTVDDVNEAVAATVACVQAQGFVTGVTPGEGLRPDALSVQVSDADGAPDPETPRAAEALIAECRASHLDPVLTAWNHQFSRPTAEQLDDITGRLDACMADGTSATTSQGTGAFAHYDDPSGNGVLTADVAPADISGYIACASQLQVETGFLAPVPGFMVTP